MANDNQSQVIVSATKEDIYSWFETDDFPTEAQFRATWDSYWHKSESLPFSSIVGLAARFNQTVSKTTFDNHIGDGEAHNLVLAKRDASNLAPAHVTAWKEKLGVGALPENVGTIDFTNSEGFSYVGNAYKKVQNPNDGNTYVLNIDGTKVNANTFGKNIANADLTTSGSFTHTQRTQDTFEWKTQGASYKVSGLPDKSADASYDEFIGRNSEGRLAKVGYPAFNKAFSSLSATEALILSQLLNGSTGGGGSINVNLISPPIIQTQYDTNEYVLLRGVNLDLNPTAMSIQILDITQTTVVATIPNNQIQLSANGLELVFFYNFHNFPVGTYFLKITSGVKTYITTLDLKFVDSVESINLNTITWERLYDSNITPNPSDYTQGANFTLTVPAGTSNIPTISIKSSEIFAQGEDFYIELKVTFGAGTVGGGLGDRMSYVGLGYSTTPNILSPVSLVYMNYRGAGQNYIQSFNNNNSQSDGGQLPFSVTIIFIKTGNLFRTIIGSSNHSVTLSNNSGYSMFVQLVGRVSAHNIQGQIIKAFKFN